MLLCWWALTSYNDRAHGELSNVAGFAEVGVLYWIHALFIHLVTGIVVVVLKAQVKG